MDSERHAVVIGASMAGLLAARVLADRVGTVTIVDRDELPRGPEPRRAVPQGRHAHGLLPAGEHVIRDLFPGLLDELVAGGAQRVTTTTGRWWQCGGYRVDAPEAPDATFFSRPYLEAGVRSRVEALPNVTLVKAAVRELVVGDAIGGGHGANRAARQRRPGTIPATISGITIDAGDGAPTTLRADLVVDASGRSSRVCGWLESVGYEAPPVDQVHVDMAYASRLYRRTPGRLPNGAWFVTIGDPAVTKRFGVAFPIEGDRWIVTLAGCHGDHPPTDDAGHLRFADTLPTGDIADILRNEEPLGPAVPHRLASSQWRRFDKLRLHPAGFLALGDAICSFNPIYGQGMSSAAQQAAVLGTCVDKVGVASPALWRSFYKEAKRIIANPWAIAAGGDFAFSETTGPKPPGTDAINRYVRKVVIAAQYDTTVANALWDVQGLLAAPPSLMKPALMLRVLRTARRGPTGPAARIAASVPVA